MWFIRNGGRRLIITLLVCSAGLFVFVKVEWFNLHEAQPAIGEVVNTAAGRMPDAEADQIRKQLIAPDAATRDAALEKIRLLMQLSPETVAYHLAIRWNKPLLEMKRYADVADWSQVAITCDTLDWPLGQAAVESLQMYRTRALLASGKTAKALSAAKSLYNVISIDNAPAAETLVNECMKASSEYSGLCARFLAEQRADPPPSTQPTAPEQPVLKRIKVDPKSYLDAVGRIDAAVPTLDHVKKFRALTQKGNLLLLADHADEAKAVFERIESIEAGHEASRTRMVAAAESIARAIHAQDGSITRAMMFLTEKSRQKK
ncbi:MAG TPA: hypothetical protein VGN12_25480 [Pirellulales bacterium]|jgi:hypothetical protein